MYVAQPLGLGHFIGGAAVLATSMATGKVYYVGAGPGDPELITVRGQDLLNHASVIIHDSEVSHELFRDCPATTQIIDAQLRGVASDDAVSRVARQVIEAARSGGMVVRLKTGDPLFFSRALVEIEIVLSACVTVEMVPGVASPLAAAAFAGVPLTASHGTLAFAAATDPSGKATDLDELTRLAVQADTLCVLLVASQLRSLVERLLAMDRFAKSRAVLVHRASQPEQRVLEAPLERLVALFESDPLPEPTLLILGAVVDWRTRLNWYESQPLFGKRLLLCRPRHQAADSARAIRRRGAVAHLLPLIEIEPITDNTALRDALPRVQEYDWVIFTSANGVQQFQNVVAQAGKDARLFGRAKIAVIGPGTARSFQLWGITPDLVAEEHVAEGLARQILGFGAARSALLVRAVEARDALPSALGAAGLQVDIVAAYITRKLADEQGQQLRSRLTSQSVDAVLLTSSSMADALVAALAPDAPSLLSDVCVASIGAITTATLEGHGIMADVTASTYTVDGLLDALESYYGLK